MNLKTDLKVPTESFFSQSISNIGYQFNHLNFKMVHRSLNREYLHLYYASQLCITVY